MSWFDTSGFANLAKSALKGAQKTIDKALDIKEEDPTLLRDSLDNSTAFFATWGGKSADKVNEKEKPSSEKRETTSIWGSFTGSFFDNSKFEDENIRKTIKLSKSLQETSNDSTKISKVVPSTSVCENIVNQSFSESTSKNVLQFPSFRSQSNVLTENVNSPMSNCEALGELNFTNLESGNSIFCKQTLIKSELSTDSIEDSYKDSMDKQDTTKKYDSFEKSENIENKGSIVKWQRINETDISKDDNNINDNGHKSNMLCALNRLSVTSIESVETLDSQSNTSINCITTPESDINSISIIVSSSGVSLKVNSESVEILPDSSMTSPSSIEVLGDWKSNSSPFLSPMDQKQFEVSPTMEKCELLCSSVIGNSSLPFSINKEEIVSCSYVSPYESPSGETKTLYFGPYPDSNVSTPSSSILPVFDIEKDLTKVNGNKISPKSNKVVLNINESDEVSLAEDSYTSTSEITVTTIMETLQQLDQVQVKLELPDKHLKIRGLCSDSKPISMTNSESQLNSSLDSLREKHNLYLPLEPITMQPICKIEHFEMVNNVIDIDLLEKLKYSTIEPPDPDSFHENERQVLNIETIESQGQYLILTDSSCEGTLIESSSEDNTVLISEAESRVVKTALTTSSYMKNMLADAMDEKGETLDLESHCIEVPRENSSISSESRSDLIKIGSDQNSGHTSSDELETTTSSDIEIISSPNGDSSSTQSRQSPAKLQQLNKSSDLLTKTLTKVRGHSREYSEISIGSDEANLEIDKLLKRIQEMTETLEIRESKLIDVSRMNMELHEQNNSLTKQLDSIEKRAEQNQDLTQITDEYTQRLSSLERKFQQAIRERDMLRKQLDQLKQEVATRLSSQEMCTMNVEKDEIIRELQEEGEKLSKQQLKLSNIIKKLRSKETENNEIMKNQKEQIEEQNLKLERLKRSLYAKEEVERTQIEAVHTLTAKMKRQEKEILNLQEKLDDALHKMDTYKGSLDVAKTDLIETKQHLAVAEKELKETVASAGESCQLMVQAQDLKIRLRQAKEAHVKREESLKQENNELLKRLEFAEAKSEELSESVSTVSKPLLRQLEQLQTNLSYKSSGFMKQEKIMSEKIIELQTKLETLIETDRSLKEQNLNLRSKISVLESKVNSNELEKVKLDALYEQIRLENGKLVEENKAHSHTIKVLEQSYSNEVKELKRENNSLKNKLSTEKAATNIEKRKNLAILEQQQSIDDLRHCPILSVRRDSLGSLNGVWPAFADSAFDNSSGKFLNVYESIRVGSNSTSMFENLQAQLKQRDGEIQQLQWELSRRNMEKDVLNSELSSLVLKVEGLNTKVSEIETLKENLDDIQTKYDALLQMYGEKVEENQELQLDLEDIKEMYKTQIVQLLKKDV